MHLFAATRSARRFLIAILCSLHVTPSLALKPCLNCTRSSLQQTNSSLSERLTVPPFEAAGAGEGYNFSSVHNETPGDKAPVIIRIHDTMSGLLGDGPRHSDIEETGQNYLAPVNVHGQRLKSKRSHRGDHFMQVTVIASGLRDNDRSDLSAFLSSLMTSTCMVVITMILFSALRLRFPQVYAGKVDADDASKNFPGFFAWVLASSRVTSDVVEATAGIDQAMFLEFTNLSLRILFVIGVPMLCIITPLNWAFGGRFARNNILSRIEVLNVEDGHPWLFWVHALSVWFVVMAVQRCIFGAMGAFMKRYWAWLREMPTPRATTIMVQNIPVEYRSDDKLENYFNNLFGARVVSEVHIVKHAPHLAKLMDEHSVMKICLDEAHFSTRSGAATSFMDMAGSIHDYAEHNAQRLKELSDQIAEERTRIQVQAASGAEGIYSNSGFVTFNNRREAELALKAMNVAATDTPLVVSVPPDPADVIYKDFRRGAESDQRGQALIGYALIALLFLVYVPGVAAILAVASLDDKAAHLLGTWMPGPGARAVWGGILASFCLQVAVSLVPSLLASLFSRFFLMRAESWLQLAIQRWFFHFEMVYVLLVTLVASALMRLDPRPTGTIKLWPLVCSFSAALPLATRFYLSYIPVQWLSHATCILRPMQLLKFMVYSSTCGAERAKELSEPEDQDYYGIGTRSARLSFMLVLCLVFCSISPLLCTLGCINFAICRLVYGYLLAFAEKPKAEQGGAFWCAQLQHVQQGMFLYISLMVGILIVRAGTPWPGALAATSGMFMYVSYARFNALLRSMCVTKLPVDGIMRELEKDVKSGRRSARHTYQQPEFCTDDSDTIVFITRR